MLLIVNAHRGSQKCSTQGLPPKAPLPFIIHYIALSNQLFYSIWVTSQHTCGQNVESTISLYYWTNWESSLSRNSLNCTLRPQQYPRDCITGSISCSKTSASLLQNLQTRDVLRLQSQALLNISQTSSTYCQGSWYCPVSNFRLMVERSMGFFTMSK